MMPEKEDRDKEEGENPKQHRDVFELPPNDHGPLRVDRVMDNRPEEAAGAEREEEGKGEQPGVTELMRVNHRAHRAKGERYECYNAKQDRQTGEPSSFEIFAFRRWSVVQAF